MLPHIIMPSFAAAGGGAFDPKLISGLKLWFDGSDSSTVTQSGGAISQWRDKSGNNNHANQSGSHKPTVATAAQNGLDAVACAASSTPYLNLTTSIAIDGATTFAIAKTVAANSVVTILGYTSSSGFETLLASTTYHVYAKVSGGGDIHIGDGTFHTAFHQITTTFPTTDPNCYMDGVSISTANRITSMASTTFNKILESGYDYSDATIGEILIYDSVLSTPNRQAVEAYLKAKWATP